MEKEFNKYIDCPECGKNVQGWVDVCTECGFPLDGGDRLSESNVFAKVKDDIVRHYEEGKDSNTYEVLGVECDVGDTDIEITACIRKNYECEDCDGRGNRLYLSIYNPFDEFIGGGREYLDYMSVGETTYVSRKAQIASKGTYVLEISIEN